MVRSRGLKRLAPGPAAKTTRNDEKRARAIYTPLWHIAKQKRDLAGHRFYRGRVDIRTVVVQQG